MVSSPTFAGLKLHRSAEQELGLQTSLLDATGHETQEKKGWQARAAAILRKTRRTNYVRHIRRRLDRWRIPTLEGHRVHRWRTNISSINKLIPPRVLACLFRAAFNGWVTSRRVQQGGYSDAMLKTASSITPTARSSATSARATCTYNVLRQNCVWTFCSASAPR